MIKKFDVEGIVVLIVEDDATMASLIASIVTAMGATSAIAADGSEGLRMAHERLPNAVVCDYYMEPVDGGCFLAGLRNSRIWKVARIPVIMFSVETDEMVVCKLRNFGATDYIAKPFNPQGFSERLYSVVDPQPEHQRGVGMDFHFGAPEP